MFPLLKPIDTSLYLYPFGMVLQKMLNNLFANDFYTHAAVVNYKLTRWIDEAYHIYFSIGMSHIANNTSSLHSIHMASCHNIFISCTCDQHIYGLDNFICSYNSEPIHAEIICILVLHAGCRTKLLSFFFFCKSFDSLGVFLNSRPNADFWFLKRRYALQTHVP